MGYIVHGVAKSRTGLSDLTFTFFSLLCILVTFCYYLLPLLGPYHFCPLLCLSLHESVPLVSLIFLKRSLVFPILLFSCISLHWSLRKAFLSLLAILWNSEFRWIYLSFSPLPFASLLYSAICKASSDNHFAFLHFFFLGMVLITGSCTVLQTSVHSFSETLSDLIPWIYLSLPLYNHKRFHLGYIWMVEWFSLCFSFLFFFFIVKTFIFGISQLDSV